MLNNTCFPFLGDACLKMVKSILRQDNGVPKALRALEPSALTLHFHTPELPPAWRRALQPSRRHQAARRNPRRKLGARGEKAYVLAPVAPPFAWLSQNNHALAATISSDHVAKSLAGTAVYTVSNSNNEFVLISDPNEAKSIGLLCFRHEDAEAFLAQVRSRRELRSAAKVVPITLDQVYMLKVEGIAFRFLPDPVQIRNALEFKSADRSAFDGVPVFQAAELYIVVLKSSAIFGHYLGDPHAVELIVMSDLLVMKKKNKRYCPIYFTKEDIEKELSKVSRVSRGPGVSQHIMVGSLEDVLRKMELSEKNSGWEDLIFIPPGKSYSQHIQDVVKA
ncbi:Tic22-like family protein [Prunus dulcis]|uniref:Protein TIC 22, chloroplastic n=1 Tax=Prunus dulcis TaxID=3755 RepID=A0A4Y1QTW6_PRUDU|nr:Tic22-like family protein [Prunus dulcis]